jgi:hypothetical protein
MLWAEDDRPIDYPTNASLGTRRKIITKEMTDEEYTAWQEQKNETYGERAMRIGASLAEVADRKRAERQARWDANAAIPMEQQADQGAL